MSNLDTLKYNNPPQYAKPNTGQNQPRTSGMAYPQGGANQQASLNYSPTGSNQQSYTSGSYGQYNPTQQQKQNIASGTWDLYKGSGGGWMNQAGNPFEIRGVDRGDDPNDYVDFFWRPAGSQGEGQQYGTLSGLAWNNNQNHPDWQSNEANSFWSSASPQFGNFWGQQLGWDRAGQQGSTPAGQPPVAPPAGIYPDQGGAGTGDGGYRVPGMGAGGAYTPDEMISIGAGGAVDAYKNFLNAPQYYPGWWGDDYQRMDTAKWQNAYPEFLDVPEYQGIQMPGDYTPLNVTPDSYQGLMEGDFNRLEESLRTPGEIAAERAFQQGGNYLKDVMGAGGMYGSSVMANQANDVLNQGYMDTMAGNAANAAAQRYGLQQQDLQFGSNFDLQRAAQQIGQNQFGASYGLQRGDLMRQNALDQYRSAMTSRNLLNDYNNQRFNFDYGLSEAGRQENNNLLQNRFQYDLASQNWRNNLYNQYMNAGLSLAGKGAPLQVNDWNYQMQQDNQNANNWAAGLDLVSRFLPSGTSWGDAASGAWNWITGG